MTTPWEVLTGTASVGDRVIVFSGWGGQAAVSAAEYLLNQGRQVEIVTPGLYVGMDVDMLSLAPLYQRLLEKGVSMTPFHAIIQIKEKTVTLLQIFSQQPQVREGVDTVVLSTPAKANDELYFALKGRVSELYRIGDCVAPRKVDSAIYEGEMVGRKL